MASCTFCLMEFLIGCFLTIMSRNRRPVRNAKTSRQHNLKIARKAKLQQSATQRRNTNRGCTYVELASRALLAEVVEIMLRRVQNLLPQQTDGKNEPVACHHVLSIGSSQIHKLKQEKFGLSNIHARAVYHGARSNGAFYEDLWSKNKYFLCEGKKYHIEAQYKEPFRYSSVLPWVCATPDFISLISSENTSFYAAIEIKSCKNLRFLNRFKIQLKVAMSCFGLKVGFLVLYLIDQPYQTRICCITCSDYLLENAKILNTQYVVFLYRIIHEIFETTITFEETQEILSDLPIGAPTEFLLDIVKKGPVRVKNCYFLSLSYKLGKGPKRYLRNTGTYYNNLSA